MITRRDIEKLSMTDPAVLHALRLYYGGRCSWEQAMMVLVEWFSTDRKGMLDMLIEAKLKAPAPVFKTQEALDAFKKEGQ